MEERRRESLEQEGEREARRALVLRVKLLLLVRLLVGDVGLLGFLQRVAALVLLLHPVDEQHDEEGSEEGSHHAAHDHRCNRKVERPSEVEPSPTRRANNWGTLLDACRVLWEMNPCSN